MFVLCDYLFIRFRFAPRTLRVQERTKDVESTESDESPVVDLAAQKAKEELAYQEWRDNAPMRYARDLQKTMPCPVYYLTKDGMNDVRRWRVTA